MQLGCRRCGCKKLGVSHAKLREVLHQLATVIGSPVGLVPFKRAYIDWSGHLLWSATWKQSPTYLIFVSRPKSRTIHSEGALS